jgi:hypothetical protein
LSASADHLVVRAVKSQQGQDVDVFAFFVYGSDLTRIADISRITRDEGDLGTEMAKSQGPENIGPENAIPGSWAAGAVPSPSAITLG